MEGVLANRAAPHLNNDGPSGGDGDDLETMSSLMACSAQPTTTLLKTLSRRYASGDQS